MKITPIASQMRYKKNSKNTNIININSKYNFSFCGEMKNSQKASSDVITISNSDEFKKEMQTLRQNSLDKRISFNDFLISAMYVYNEHANYFPIVEDFFETKIKKRFIKVINDALNHDTSKNLERYLGENYYWGLFSDKKYGSSYSFATAIPCVLPYAKEYDAELRILQLKDLENKEKGLRSEVENLGKSIRAKEILNHNYIQLVQTASNNPSVALPNAIMLEGKNNKLLEEIVIWTFENTQANKIIVSSNESDSNQTIKNKLESALEKATSTYNNYHIPTLIFCENFDKLLQKTNPEIEISKMKTRLTNAYPVHKATILFITNDSSNINSILKQPHRIMRINIDDADI